MIRRREPGEHSRQWYVGYAVGYEKGRDEVTDLEVENAKLKEQYRLVCESDNGAMTRVRALEDENEKLEQMCEIAIATRDDVTAENAKLKQAILDCLACVDNYHADKGIRILTDLGLEGDLDG